MRASSHFSTFASLALAAVFSLLVLSPRAAQATPIGCTSTCLFYGGDFNPNDPNANGLRNDQSSGTEATVYVPFVVPIGQVWNITGLFSNNFMNYTAQTANWSIRSGVSAGNGGSVLYSGSSNSPVIADTGASNFGYEIFAVGVNGLTGIQLAAGTYWLSVQPSCPSCAGPSFMTDTDGSNAIGTPEPQDQSYFDSATYSTNFQNANSQAVFHAFSAGVIGTLATGVPEPAGLGVFGAGLLLLAGLAWRRRYGA